MSVPPAPLERAPRVDMEASMAELDDRVCSAVETVSQRLLAQVDESLSISEVQLLTTRAHLALAMNSTHRSIRRLLARDEEDLDTAVDALPLTRVQLERCFLVLLLADHPGRWHARYRKNAWKAFAEKFFRDQRAVGHFDAYKGHFGVSGDGIAVLRAFAHEMDVSEDEFQTVRRQVLCDDEEDPRWKQWYIPDMPTPGKCPAELEDATWKRLAELLYPHYDNLSHFSHGGLVGVMGAAVLRDMPDAIDRDKFWTSAVVEAALPASYATTMFVATLTAVPFLSEEQVRTSLVEGWRPYVCDGCPLGVALWDAWARDVLSEA